MNGKSIDCELVLKCLIHNLRQLKGVDEAYESVMDEMNAIQYTRGEIAGYSMALRQIERLIESDEYLAGIASEIKDDETFPGMGTEEDEL